MHSYPSRLQNILHGHACGSLEALCLFLALGLCSCLLGYLRVYYTMSEKGNPPDGGCVRPGTTTFPGKTLVP
jgi:hypothetical protein